MQRPARSECGSGMSEFDSIPVGAGIAMSRFSRRAKAILKFANKENTSV